MIRTYYRLVKPGIVYSNTFAALAAFVFGSLGSGDPRTLLFLAVGLALSIAGATTINNVFDRDIDARMARTRKRALPTGLISVRAALTFGTVLSVIGLSLLAALVSFLAAGLTALSALLYLFVYTPAKRRTPHSTILGAIPGALPPVIGYAAATGMLDITALLLFLALVTWQMAHFYAIGIYREDDYRAAGLPIMPVHAGPRVARHLVFLYALAFLLCIYALGHSSMLGISYWALSGSLALAWFLLGCAGYFTTDLRRWARRMFFLSLVVLIGFCVSLAFS